MTLTEARKHQGHRCDVYTLGLNEHIGVIGTISKLSGEARVGGHPQYGYKWVALTDLETSCKL